MDSMGNGGLLPATRADVEGVKADVESLRVGVKADIGRLDASVRRLALEIVDVKTELREFKGVVVTKTDMQRFIDAVENFAGKDHERRIKGLEDRPH